MKYRFRKLYADLVTDDGTVCTAYWAQTDFLGRRYPHAGLEIYWPDGRHEVIRTNISKDITMPLIGTDPELPRLDIPGGPLVVEVEAEVGPWIPDSDATSQGVDWSVAHARAQVTCRWTGDSSRSILKGTGYVDWVDISSRLRRPIYKQLHWGRIHFSNRTIVFNAVQRNDGVRLYRLASWSKSELVETVNHFAIIERADEIDLVLLDGKISLEPVRLLHEGSAFNAARFPYTFERLFVRILAGPISETRWLSRANDSVEENPEKGWAVHERVFFGRNRLMIRGGGR